MADKASYADKLRRVCRLGDPPLNAVFGESEEEDQRGMAATMSQLLDQKDGLHHPTKASPGERLPDGYSRSYAGFLLCDQRREVTVDQHIAFFLGGKPVEAQLFAWIAQLQTQVQGTILFGRHLGRGFFTLKTDHVDIVRALLLLIPYRTPIGICVFQRWTAGFNPNAD
jgi:hypothetical protein